LDQGSIASFIGSVLSISTPILLVASTELVSQRAGVINLGAEGSMLFGAFASYVTALYTGSPLLGLLAGIICGAAVSSIFAALTAYAKLDQVVAGVSISMISLGVTSYLYRAIVGYGPPPKLGSTLGYLEPPGIPFIAEALRQNILTYIALALPIAVWLSIERSPLGGMVKASGEDPGRACRLGVDVSRLRTSILAIEGGFAGAAGALLSIGYYSSFIDNMTAGRGYVAVAIVILSGWSPIKLLPASLLFSLLDAAQLRLQALGVFEIPYQAALAMPYIFALAALTASGRSGRAPKALGSSEYTC